MYNWKTHNKTKKFIKTPDFHKEIWKYLDKGINLNIIIPRGHGKTTALLIWIIYALLYGLESEILYVASEGLGKKAIARVKRELETNKTIIHVFGEQRPTKIYKKNGDDGKRWTMTMLQLVNGGSIETKSAGQKIRGDRPTKIIFDDPQENKDVENKEVVDKFNIWAFTSLFNTLLPKGSMVALGTIIGNLCFVKYLRDDRQWLTVEYVACNDDFSNPLWKEMWSSKDLKERRDGSIITNDKGEVIGRDKGIGSAFFNQEFRNIPLNLSNAVIKSEWIQYYDFDINYKRLAVDYDNIIMAIDPATSTKESKTGDSSGISVVGVKNGFYFVLYSKAHKLSSLELVEESYKIFRRFKPRCVIFEKNKEETIGNLLMQKQVPIIMEHAHKDKMTRLLSQQYKFQTKMVFFPINGECEEAVYQLTTFPEIEHDDIMDSIVYCLAFDIALNKVKINTDKQKTIAGNIFTQDF